MQDNLENLPHGGEGTPVVHDPKIYHGESGYQVAFNPKRKWGKLPNEVKYPIESWMY